MSRSAPRRTACLAVFVSIAAFSVSHAVSALAAGPGLYGPPEWLPLHASSDGAPYVVGCVRTNCTISGAPYHNYWAIDLIDHGQRPGAPVFAAGEGQVIAVQGAYSSCGGSLETPANYVVIDHGGRVVSEYVHLTTVSVSPSQWVDPNTQIGTIGAVGYTFPCPYYHLHYQVFANGSSIDPGPLKACHGASMVSYPSALGYSSWDAVPPYELGVWSDGPSCGQAAPGAPTAISVAAGDGQATISFSPPASDGLNQVTSYTVTASPGGANAVGEASPITLSGLTNGTTYTFTVAATNAIGTGPPSSPSAPVVPAGLPGPPTRVTAVAGNRRAVVRFAGATENGSSITSYVVTALPSGASATTSGSPATILRLMNGRSYRFSVRAMNDVGLGPPSPVSNAVVPAVKCAVGHRSTKAKPCRR